MCRYIEETIPYLQHKQLYGICELTCLCRVNPNTNFGTYLIREVCDLHLSPWDFPIRWKLLLQRVSFCKGNVRQTENRINFPWAIERRVPRTNQNDLLISTIVKPTSLHSKKWGHEALPMDVEYQSQLSAPTVALTLGTDRNYVYPMGRLRPKSKRIVQARVLGDNNLSSSSTRYWPST